MTKQNQLLKEVIFYFIHRRGAKRAENICFMFAVDPPKIPADRKDGKHKGQSALKRKKTLMRDGVK